MPKYIANHIAIMAGYPVCDQDSVNEHATDRITLKETAKCTQTNRRWSSHHIHFIRRDTKSNDLYFIPTRYR